MRLIVVENVVFSRLITLELKSLQIGLLRSPKGQSGFSDSSPPTTYNSVIICEFLGHGKVRGQNDVDFQVSRPKKHIIAS